MGERGKREETRIPRTWLYFQFVFYPANAKSSVVLGRRLDEHGWPRYRCWVSAKRFSPLSGNRKNQQEQPTKAQLILDLSVSDSSGKDTSYIENIPHNFWYEFSSPYTEAYDDVAEDPGHTTEPLPYFEDGQNSTNVTTQLGQTVFLHCRVCDLSDKTVSFLWWILAEYWHWHGKALFVCTQLELVDWFQRCWRKWWLRVVFALWAGNIGIESPFSLNETKSMTALSMHEMGNKGWK